MSHCSGHLKLDSLTSQWVHVQPTNLQQQVWCYHVNVDKNFWARSPGSCWRQNGVQAGTSKVYLTKWPLSVYITISRLMFDAINFRFPCYPLHTRLLKCIGKILQNFVKWPHNVITSSLHDYIIKNIKLATESDLLWKVSYFAALAHRSSEERMLQRDVEAPTGDADIWTNTHDVIFNTLFNILIKLMRDFYSHNKKTQCAHDQ